MTVRSAAARQPVPTEGAFLLAAVLLTAGCPHSRKPVQMHDAGPAVVLVDGTRRPPTGRPQLPLVDEQEPDDDRAHAQPLQPQKGVRGRLTPPPPHANGKPPVDVDVYSWLEAGTPSDGGFNEARIEITGVPGARLTLEALDGDGHPLLSVKDAEVGAGALLPNLAVEPGHTYYVRVTGTAPEPLSGTYELTVVSANASPGAEREPNDDPAHATPLVGISDANGYFGRRRDEDWLRVPLGAVPPASGEAILRLELAPVDNVAVQLRVLHGADVVATARAGRGEELRLRNVGVPAVAADASALIALKALEGQNVEARWGLRIAIEPPLDGAEHEPNDTPKDAAAHPLVLAPGGTVQVSGFLWPGDVDVFRVTGAADALVTAELEGLDRVDLKLDRLDAAGKLLARADDGGAGKGELLPPWPLGGDALFRVSGRAHDVAFDAPYHLTISSVVAAAALEREPNNTPATATVWPAGAAAVPGYLAPRGDEDWFRFVAPSGKTRAVVELSGPSGLVVHLTDASRAPLGPSEGPERASGPVAGGQSYLISVKGQTDKISSPRDPYTLRLRFE